MKIFGCGRISGLLGRLTWRGLSLRSRIALIAAAAMAVAVIAVSAVVFLAVGAQLRHQLDEELTADSHTVAETPASWTGESVPGRDRDHDHDVGPRIQVLDVSGRPVLRASQSQALPVTGTAAAVARGQQLRVFEDVRVDGRQYRMLTTPVEHGAGAVQVAMSTESIDHPLTSIGLVLIVVSACGVAVAAGLGFLVARTGLAPVHRLTAAVEHVATTNDLSSRIDVTGRDEIARLAHAFNAMLTALQSSRAAQRLLVDDAGHELRTPLTSLRANIDLLIRADERAGTGRTLAPEDHAELLRDLDAQTAELTQLVVELVELTRDEGSTEPAERVDLADLVDRAGQDARQRWPQTTFVTELEPVSMSGHPAPLERMVSNLLDNAAKWGPARAVVRVRLSSIGRLPDQERSDPRQWAELTVADSGPGIDAADLPRIFERFYRATSARGMPGSGLGLAIVAQAVDLHKGTITAGRSDTGGALFTVRLPVLAATPAAQGDAPA